MFKKEIMDGEKKEKLTGFRNPTANEKERVYNHVKKECGYAHRFDTFWRIFFEFIAVSCIATFVKYLYQGGMPIREVIFVLILGILLIICVLKMKKEDRRLLRIISTIKDGNFQVIDCYSTKLEMFIGGDGSHDAGIVYLETAKGQLCCDKFIISSKDARANRNRTRVPLILIVQRELDYYEVLVNV